MVLFTVKPWLCDIIIRLDIFLIFFYKNCADYWNYPISWNVQFVDTFFILFWMDFAGITFQWWTLWDPKGVEGQMTLSGLVFCNWDVVTILWFFYLRMNWFHQKNLNTIIYNLMNNQLSRSLTMVCFLMKIFMVKSVPSSHYSKCLQIHFLFLHLILYKCSRFCDLPLHFLRPNVKDTVQ